MAKDPAFLFYSGDWIVGTQTMTMAERGQYITLIAQMHQQGRMTLETIRFLVGSVSDNLLTKFEVDGNGKYYNSRLELEAERRAKFTESRRENGLKGGRPINSKQKTTKKSQKASENHTDNRMGNENENENGNKNGEGIAKGRDKFVAPELAEVEAFVVGKGFPVELARRAFEYYSTADWRDSHGRPVKNWKQKLIAVWLKPENNGNSKNNDGGLSALARAAREGTVKPLY